MTSNIKNNRKKPLLLCILDGFGIGDESSKNNAIALAKTPNRDAILQNYPHSKLGASGGAVGLPDGQIGNSEVGHVSIGSGRIIFQDLPRINNALKDGSLEQNKSLQNLITNCQKTGGSCHLISLLSDGGVHSHQDHIIALANIVAQAGVKVKLHAFLDGRDVAQKSALNYIKYFTQHTKQHKDLIQISTIGGRYYGMDRDNKWDRVKISYDSIVNNIGKNAPDAIHAIEAAYKENITDEFIIPTSIGNYEGMKDGDALLMANFRADRVRQIANTLLDDNFKEFETRKIHFCAQVKMTKYSDNLSDKMEIIFPPIDVRNSLGEVLEKHNLTQLRIAETEKYAHVTFFFSGGREDEYKGEKRIMIKSPDVATYDLQPEMSAQEVGKELVKAINSGEYDFIVVNYANPDMVGHSGILQSAIKACETIDGQLGNLRDAILKQDGLMLITADHGNIEDMVDEAGKPHTAHTNNPVPFILIGNEVSDIELEDGRLCDIAPTILQLMNIDQPKEMTGNSLIKSQSSQILEL